MRAGSPKRVRDTLSGRIPFTRSCWAGSQRRDDLQAHLPVGCGGDIPTNVGHAFRAGGVAFPDEGRLCRCEGPTPPICISRPTKRRSGPRPVISGEGGLHLQPKPPTARLTPGRDRQVHWGRYRLDLPAGGTGARGFENAGPRELDHAQALAGGGFVVRGGRVARPQAPRSGSGIRKQSAAINCPALPAGAAPLSPPLPMRCSVSPPVARTMQLGDGPGGSSNRRPLPVPRATI